MQHASRALVPYSKDVRREILLHLSAVARPSAGSGGVAATVGARTRVSQSAVKATTALIRHLPSSKLTHDELKAVVSVIDADLEVPERQNSTFALLRAVLLRRLVSPEMYDLMDRVGKFMIRSSKAGARAQSA